MTRLHALLLPVILAALCAAAAAHASPLNVSVRDARVVEGDSGTTHLEFEVVANGPPRRLALTYSLTDLTASAAGGDYTASNAVVTLTPLPARLVRHWAAGSLDIPDGVAVAPNGDVIAANGPTVYRFSKDGTLLGTFGVSEHPEKVAVNPAGDIYITNFYDYVSKYDANGNLILIWGGTGSAPGRFSHPEDIAVDAEGFVYVSDVFNNRIQKFDANGTFVGMWSTAMPDDPEYDGPLGVAVDTQGNVYVAKGISGRILKYGPDGTLIATWTDTKGLCIACDLDIDDAGNLLIADCHASRVVVLDREGMFLTEWTLDEGPEHNPREISATCVVSDDNGNVYVGSRYSSSIAHFRWDRAEGTIVVPVTGETAFEPDESLKLDLADTPNAMLIDATAIGTIVNDDPDLGTNQAANGDFESGREGWSAYQGATLEPSTDGIGGSNAARLIGTGTVAFGLNDSPDIVSSTGADSRYRYSAWVRSASTGSVRLRVREYLAGKLVATTGSTPIAFDGSWQRLEVPIRARTTGATLDFQVIGEFATTGQEFLIDDVAVQTLGADVPPVVQADAEATGSWLSEVVVEVSARDPEGEPIDFLDADLSGVPGASFSITPDKSRGSLRWHPSLDDVREEPHIVTFTARNAAVTSATTRIRVSPNLVLNPSFEKDIGGWGGHVDAALTRVPGGRRDGYAARLTLPGVEWAGINDSPNWAAPVGLHRRFIFGAWVRAETNGGRVRMQVREYQGGMTLGSSTMEGPPFLSIGGLAQSWRRIVMAYTCVADGASDLDLTIDAQGPSGETFEIDDVSIVNAGSPSLLSVPEAPPLALAARVIPNPARGRLMLELSVPTSGRLHVELYDLAGRRRAVIADEARVEAGVRRFELRALDRRLDPGIYWYRASMAAGTRQGRFVVLE